MTIVAGIDFGTSNSSVSYIQNDSKAKFVELEKNKITMPTALFFSGENRNNILFGSEAMQAFMDGECGRFMRSIKRILGSSLMNSGTYVNGQYMEFNSIIGTFIGHLKMKLEEYTECPITDVVIGRPVTFCNNNEKDDAEAERQLKNIAHKSGFKNVEFQFEPIAAAFAHERNIIGELLACVVDIGGGTSDFTIIRIGEKLRDKRERSSDILGNTGIRIGGNDFDKNLSIVGFMPELGRGTTHGIFGTTVPVAVYSELSEWSSINFAYVPKTKHMVIDILRNAHDKEKYSRLLDLLEHERGHELLQIVEQCKIELTNNKSVIKILGCVKDKPQVVLTSDLFNQCINSDVVKIRKSMNEVLIQADVPADRIELVILTGGSTEVPAIKQVVRDEFPQAKFLETNKLTSVGEGLAYDSYRRYNVGLWG
ncbi:MAG: Hsp70 family protein [Bacteroidales bacterium]|jgi:hypothetical chaperone protein|nr:Hsp70 family protein [Bacteroidales bacterium]